MKIECHDHVIADQPPGGGVTSHFEKASPKSWFQKRVTLNSGTFMTGAHFSKSNWNQQELGKSLATLAEQLWIGPGRFSSGRYTAACDHSIFSDPRGKTSKNQSMTFFFEKPGIITPVDSRMQANLIAK